MNCGLSPKQAGSSTDHKLMEALFPLEAGLKAVVMQRCCWLHAHTRTNGPLCSHRTPAEPVIFAFA